MALTLRRVVASLAAASVVAVVADAGTAVSASAVGEAPGAPYLVRFVPGTDMSAAARSLRADGVAVERTFTRAIDAAAVAVTTAEATELAGEPGVLSVERDVRFTVAGTQAAPTWGLDRIDQRALPLSATFTTPASVAPVDAYVIDTGTASGHADLTGRVRAGWSAIDTGPGDTDCHGHGTHVAGTIAGSAYGVAKTATVVPVRVLDCLGSGLLSEVIAGIDWVVGQHQPGVPAVANLSLGGPPDTALDAALSALIADGVAVAVAAGNSGVDACGGSPARLPAALTVAASDAADRQAAFSNVGPCVDLYAPGVAITSAWPTGPADTRTISGTSMAAPHVAGAAAVLLSLQPGLAPAQVSGRLVADATAGVVQGVTAGTANRLLFLDQYVAVPVPPAPPPPPPTGPPPPASVVRTAPGEAASVSAAPRSRSARVGWRVGADGGSPITEQRIRVYRTGERIRTVVVPAGEDHQRVERLKPGVPYRFTVTLRNAVGSSPESGKTEVVRPRD